MLLNAQQVLASVVRGIAQTAPEVPEDLVALARCLGQDCEIFVAVGPGGRRLDALFCRESGRGLLRLVGDVPTSPVSHRRGCNPTLQPYAHVLDLDIDREQGLVQFAGLHAPACIRRDETIVPIEMPRPASNAATQQARDAQTAAPLEQLLLWLGQPPP